MSESRGLNSKPLLHAKQFCLKNLYLSYFDRALSSFIEMENSVCEIDSEPYSTLETVIFPIGLSIRLLSINPELCHFISVSCNVVVS